MAIHDPILAKLRRKIRRERADERDSLRRASIAKRRIAFLQQLIAKHVHLRRKGIEAEAVLDGTPMPLGQKLVLLDARRNGWNGVATSGDRRDHPPRIVRLIHKLGKMTQAELYAGFKAGKPGFLPANPPDRGSHMRIGDGVFGALFSKLAWWEEGIDATLSTTLRSVLGRLGYKAARPYASASEEHHTNLTADPKRRLIERGQI